MGTLPAPRILPRMPLQNSFLGCLPALAAPAAAAGELVLDWREHCGSVWREADRWSDDEEADPQEDDAAARLRLLDKARRLAPAAAAAAAATAPAELGLLLPTDFWRCLCLEGDVELLCAFVAAAAAPAPGRPRLASLWLHCPLEMSFVRETVPLLGHVALQPLREACVRHGVQLHTDSGSGEQRRLKALAGQEGFGPQGLRGCEVDFPRDREGEAEACSQ